MTTALKLVAPAPAMPATIGNNIDMLFTLRERKRKLEAEVKAIEASYAETEERLMAQLEAQGLDGSRGKKATCSISTSVVGTPTDWDAFCTWAQKKKYLHLFQRRLSDPALRELWEKGVVIPGVDKFTRKRLNVLTIT